MTRHWWARAALVAAGLTLAACGKSPQAHLDAGKAYAAEGKYREAAIEFRSAVTGDPTLAEAELRLAEALLRSGSQEAALGAMERAATLMPANADVQTRAGSMLLLAGRLPEARARAEKALAIEPNRVDALVLRGNVLAGLADFDGALSELQHALTLEPTSAVLTNLGTVLAAKAEPGPAEAAFRQAIAAAPKSATPHLALAHFLWSAGRLADTEAEFQAALAAEPGHPLALKGLGLFYVTTGRAPAAEPYLKRRADASSSPVPKLELASYYLTIGRREDATRTLTAVEQMPGAWVTARTILASMALSGGEPARAQALADEVIAREPNAIDASVVRASALAAQGQWEPALETLNRALEANPRHLGALYARGRLHATRAALDDAAGDFSRVLGINPRAIAAQIALARVQLALGRSAAALTTAGAAVTAGGGVLARLVLAEAYANERRFADAERELTAAVAAQPDLALAHVQLGRVRQAMRQAAPARAAFMRALALDPASVPALTGLTELEFAAGQRDAALARVRQAARRVPRTRGCGCCSGDF